MSAPLQHQRVVVAVDGARELGAARQQVAVDAHAAQLGGQHFLAGRADGRHVAEVEFAVDLRFDSDEPRRAGCP